MNGNYYDVVVMGMELGPLVAGTLLAKRGFRVLAVGQGGASDYYNCYGYTFTNRPFIITAAYSPVIGRVLDELSLTPTFQQITKIPSPLFQIVSPHARVNVFEAPDKTEKEIIRELQSDTQDTKGILRMLGELGSEVKKLLDTDLVIPPETFFERREFSRAEVQNPFYMTGNQDPYHKVGARGQLKELLNVPVRWETAGTIDVAPLVTCRQISGWFFGTQSIQNGRDGLRRLLLDKIINQGGDVYPDQTVTSLILSKGKINAIRLRDHDEPTGCQIVLTDLSPKEIAPLISPDVWPKRFRALVEDTPRSALGYSLNLGLDPEVIPAGLAQTAFVSFGKGIGDQLVRIEQIPQNDKTKAALNISCIVSSDEESQIETGALRDALLDRIRQIVPFLDNYLHVVHSPFDAFGPLVISGNAEGDAPAIPRPEEVPKWLLRTPPDNGALGVENLPHRTGVKGLFLAGSQVVSGLGTEGEFLAAWGAARIASKMDPSRERLVRSMRSKIEV